MARQPGHPSPQRGNAVALTPDEADRYREVVNLRRAGWTFDEIADQVGYANRSSAKTAYDAALARWGTEAVEEVRAAEGERLDQLWRRVAAAIAQLGADADPKELATLINSAVRLSQARRQLFGMDAPKQIELAGKGGGPVETDIGEVLRQRVAALDAAQQ